MAAAPTALTNSRLILNKGFELDSDGMVLWYNQPAALNLSDGFQAAYTDSTGRQIVSQWPADRSAPQRRVLAEGEPNDHSAPALCGEDGNLVLSAWHGSPLRVLSPSSAEPWGARPTTYPRCAVLPGGDSFVITRGHPLDGPGSKRGLLIGGRMSAEGAQGQPQVVIDWGEGHIVYAGPLRQSRGRLAVAWSVTSTDEPSANAVWLAESQDDGRTWSAWSSADPKPTLGPETRPIWQRKSGGAPRILDLRATEEGWLIALSTQLEGQYKAGVHSQGLILRAEPSGVQEEPAPALASGYYGVGMCFDQIEEGIAYATPPAAETNRLVRLRFADGAWIEAETLAFDPRRWVSNPVPVIGQDGGPRVLWAWSTRYARFDDFRSSLYAWPG